MTNQKILLDGSTWIPTQTIVVGLRPRAEADGHRHNDRRHQGLRPAGR